MSICPNCGETLDIHYEGSTASLSCPNCGWAVASTRYRLIDEDDATYAIILEKNDAPTPLALKTLARLSGGNFVTARQLMLKAPIVVYEGTARDVLEQSDALKDAGISFTVEPDFPYSRNDEEL